MYQVMELKHALPENSLPILHVEVCQKYNSTLRSKLLQEKVTTLLNCSAEHSVIFGDTHITDFEDSFLADHVQYISISDTDAFIKDKKNGLKLSNVELQIHVYQLHMEAPAQEELDDEELAAASHWMLPNAEFTGLWESLVFDSHIKTQLLQYASTTLLFSDKCVDCNIISWNRVILLHGPPGTGKTSLCKALAQKLVINLSHRYSFGQLIEINSHSLFSKWFSESGKLVMKMFEKIQEFIADKDSLVCVLIDEVESLSAARQGALSGNEPSDSIRVVNALLTQLDHIKKYPNVVILTTSNITGAIDLAFVDRADVKQYIGPPSSSAIYQIYFSCIQELIKRDIIVGGKQICKLQELELFQNQEQQSVQLSYKLKDIAIKSEGLSGRTLRKLPFLAHALYLQTPKVSLSSFLEALYFTVERQFEERKDLSTDLKKESRKTNI